MEEMKKSEHLKLNLPNGNNNVRIEDLSENFNILDEKIFQLGESSGDIKEGLEKDIGNVLDLKTDEKTLVGAINENKNSIEDKLKNVKDYGIATTDEAEEGTLDNKYMTPKKVRESIIKNTKKIVIVNNLTDGGIDKALSAEQGKELFQSGIERNKELVANLNSKKVSATTNDSLKVNIEKVKEIVTDPSIGTTAKSADLLKGKTAVSDGKAITGSMVDRGTLNKTLTTQNGQISLSSGYYVGGIVKAQFNNILPQNIKDGINIGGVTGNLIDLLNISLNTTNFKLKKITSKVITEFSPLVKDVPIFNLDYNKYRYFFVSITNPNNNTDNVAQKLELSIKDGAQKSYSTITFHDTATSYLYYFNTYESSSVFWAKQTALSFNKDALVGDSSRVTAEVPLKSNKLYPLYIVDGSYINAEFTLYGLV